MQNVSHDENKNNHCLYTCKYVCLILIIIFNPCPLYIEYLLMIKSEDFIFVQRHSSPEYKNIYSNTDDQFVVIQVHIFSSCSAYPGYLGRYIHFFFKTKNKPCTKKQKTNDLNKWCTLYSLNILNRLQKKNIE